MNLSAGLGSLSHLGFLLYVLYGFIIVVVHLFFALGVLRDAQRQQNIVHRGIFLVSPGLWFLATLIGGLIPVGIYWVVHHSTLRPVTEHGE